MKKFFSGGGKFNIFFVIGVILIISDFFTLNIQLLL